jgi:hypothetical protein
MSANPLLDSILDLMVSDPWEFGTECGTAPFSASVTDASQDALLVHLEKSLRYQGKKLVCVLVRPRHAGDSVNTLIQSRKLMANFLFLAREVSSLAGLRESEDGIAAIGSANAR